MSLQLLVRLLIIWQLAFSPTSGSDEHGSECKRHRKPWHMLSEQEQMLYVTGFKELRNNGILDQFIKAHHLSDTPTSFADVHFTAQFFPWHSYFLTEIESQIRNLGGPYTCFSLPYWDFTVDSGYPSANDMPIYNSFLGQDGNEAHDYCVEDSLWNRDAYPTTYLCSATERNLGVPCCLKRHHGERGHIPDASAIVPTIYTYRKWREFQDAVVKQHTYVHGYISANNNATHMFGHNAAEDPLFILLHNFLMYIRALRTTCFGYDKVINELERYQPYAYDPYQADRMADMKPFLDAPMDFNILADKQWTTVSQRDISVRDMFDLQTFDISFELGTFWHTSDELKQFCGDSLNETWFYDTLIYDQQAEQKEHVFATSWKWDTQHIKVMYLVGCLSFLTMLLALACVVCRGLDEGESYESIMTEKRNALDNYGAM